MKQMPVNQQASQSVSVCMATCNGARYVVEQIQSILLQLAPADELVISDDNSTDNTVSLIQSFKDARIKLLQNTGKRLGVIENFEKVLNHAKGDYIFLCDQDDVWLQSKVEICVQYLQHNLLVVTDCSVVNEDLSITHPSFFRYRHSGEGVLKNIWKNTFLGCCIGFRRELLKLSLPMPHKIPMHDMWLGLLANIHGNVAFIDKPLSLYRRHELAASSTASKSNFGLIAQLKIRLILTWHLFFRTMYHSITKKFK